MRRSLTVLAMAFTLAAALAAPALAAKPVGACPNPGFVAMTYAQFRALSLQVGVPEELLGAEHAAQFATINKNNDPFVCVMNLPDTPGTLDGWIFNVIDNTARAR